MQLWIGGCIAGLSAASFWPLMPALPTTPVLFALLIVGVLLASLLLASIARRRAAVMSLLFSGFMVGLLFGLLQLQHDWQALLPPHEQGELQRIEGHIVGAIRYNQRFGQRVARFEFLTVPAPKQRRLLLSWPAAPDLQPGQHWQFFVKLKRPRGLANPAGFDYQLYLMQQGIHASGTVRQGVRLANDVAVNAVLAIRMRLQALLEQQSIDADSRRALLALGLGNKQALSSDDWLRYQQTGTTHLFIVSGLHISLLAALVFYLTRRLVGFVPGLLIYVPAQYLATLLSVLAALFYAQLSGFALPAQRAFLMLLLAAMLRVFYGRVPLQLLFSLVLLMLLADQPLMLRSAGLHLSFLAVAILLWQNQARQPASKALQWLRAQLLVTAFLTPVLLYWFGFASLLAPLANAVAIPVVSLVLVPLVLLLLLALALGLALPQLLLALPGNVLSFLDRGLESMFLAGAQLTGQPSLLVVVLALLGVFLVAAPRGMPGRVLSVLFLLPIIMSPFSHENVQRLTMLDVGQGLAMVFEAEGKVLVYDAGPRFDSGFDAGQVVVLPYLRMRGYQKIDALVISHGDMDHAGGSGALAQMPITQRWHGEPTRHNVLAAPSCHGAASWQWQHVQFEFLALPALAGASANNRSCVLRISAGGRRILLTGDIEAAGEAALVATHGAGKLQADVLLLAHHGSKTSSTPELLASVAPDIALVSNGFQNRFGHPHASVVQRLQQQGIRVYSSAELGAVSISWQANGPLTIKPVRESAGYFWWRAGR